MITTEFVDRGDYGVYYPPNIIGFRVLRVGPLTVDAKGRYILLYNYILCKAQVVCRQSNTYFLSKAKAF